MLSVLMIYKSIIMTYKTICFNYVRFYRINILQTKNYFGNISFAMYICKAKLYLKKKIFVHVNFNRRRYEWPFY